MAIPKPRRLAPYRLRPEDVHVVSLRGEPPLCQLESGQAEPQGLPRRRASPNRCGLRHRSGWGGWSVGRRSYRRSLSGWGLGRHHQRPPHHLRPSLLQLRNPRGEPALSEEKPAQDAPSVTSNHPSSSSTAARNPATSPTPTNKTGILGSSAAPIARRTPPPQLFPRRFRAPTAFYPLFRRLPCPPTLPLQPPPLHLIQLDSAHPSSAKHHARAEECRRTRQRRLLYLRRSDLSSSPIVTSAARRLVTCGGT